MKLCLQASNEVEQQLQATGRVSWRPEQQRNHKSLLSTHT